jgi:hypothetical protein
MTIIFRDGFENGTLAAFTGVVGTVSVVTDTPFEGAYCARCTTPGAGSDAAPERSYVYRGFSPSLSKVFAQAKVRFRAAPNTADRRVTLISMVTSGNASVVGSCGVQFTGGALRWYLSKATKIFSTVTVNLNQWYIVELMQDQVGEGLVLYVDGVEVLRLAEVSTEKLGTVRFGATSSTTNYPITLDIDDCIIADAYIGAAPKPRVTVRSDPELNVPVYVGNVFMGNTPLVIELPGPGTYTVKVDAEVMR